MECPKCLIEMEANAVVVHVTGGTVMVDSLTCPDCGESFVPMDEELVPVGEYEAFEGAPDEPLTEADIDRMFAEGV